MNTTLDIVVLAQEYAKYRRLALSTVGRLAAKDGRFFSYLDSGRSTTTFAKAAKVTQWFSDHWPDDLDWPVDIPRPESSIEEPEQ